jgi:acetyl-CoA carboxylase biotin carboxyl carrier protein
MDFALIERLMRMLETSSLNELDVTEGGMRIRLAKAKGGASDNVIPVAKPAVEAPATPDTGSNLSILSAGMAGTFYRAPAPGAEPFVVPGATVTEGQQLAIIEAMKMLNPVEADRNGVVRTIFVEDGGSVEPGTALFEIEAR